MNDRERAEGFLESRPHGVVETTELAALVAAVRAEGRIEGARLALEAVAKVCDVRETECKHTAGGIRGDFNIGVELYCGVVAHDLAAAIRALSPEAIVAEKEPTP